ncbi:ras and ef-hand domain-containing protein [Anaeramoeba flamelloides]|uniref:Ras and ef-hand domain-containing protein n=1 Tax=Anaeramoeba flamelloides TaxID=1746091 RepID=A0AAV7ZUB9_9EUKA|nr:ras and ef-hand domain-containing protein [Anaeramoeba flamelloides]KAJ6253152.1 ras and ef-hand domain-containing protein [Anaeramoeba flamelloides]
MSSTDSELTSSSEEETQYDFLFKIVLVGQGSVGKTCLILQYCENTFRNETMITIGIEFMTKYVNLHSKTVAAQIWDTAGQEKFRAIPATLFRGSHAVIFVYDVTNYESFEKVQYWIEQADKHCPKKKYYLLIGNKIDCVQERKVSKEAGEMFAKEHNMNFLETSAKTAQNVNQAFLQVLNAIYDMFVINQDNEEQEKNSKVKNAQSGGSIKITKEIKVEKKKKCCNSIF